MHSPETVKRSDRFVLPQDTVVMSGDNRRDSKLVEGDLGCGDKDQREEETKVQEQDKEPSTDNRSVADTVGSDVGYVIACGCSLNTRWPFNYSTRRFERPFTSTLTSPIARRAKGTLTTSSATVTRRPMILQRSHEPFVMSEPVVVVNTTVCHRRYWPKMTDEQWLLMPERT